MGGGRGGGRGDIEKGERGERVCFFCSCRYTVLFPL